MKHYLPMLLAASTLSLSAAPQANLADFQANAAKHGLVLQFLDYPTTAEAVKSATEGTLKKADAAIAALVAQAPAKLTFQNTFAELDRITAPVNDMSNLVGTLAQASKVEDVRNASSEAEVRLKEWSVALTYREDLYRVLKAVADTKPKLDAESQRMMDFVMRDYRRAGLSLPAAERAEVERLQKELAGLTTEFGVNVNQARGPIDFTAEELAGVPASFLESPGVKQADGRYRVMANITWHAVTIGENADNPETRHRLAVVRSNLAREKNIPLMAKLVAVRGEIARRLGYASWADYQTETRMAKSGAAVVKFEEDLVAGLQPKFAAELETLRALKAKHIGQADAKIEPWDVSYYTNRLMKEKYSVDTEALRVYFPYEATLNGMFAIYQKIFGLKFAEVQAPYVWAPEVKLYVVSDSATGKPIGAFYLDMFPREGKYNHFACFQQKLGSVLADGRYDLPVAALLCNFPVPSADKPSLMSHDNVETLFHEFGHVMHGMLSRSKYVYLTGFAVPQDFVEAPSQMLEAWAWDKAVLDTFAADYRDPSKRIPAETIAAMEAARMATEGYATRRQLALGLIDLALHARPVAATKNVDVVAETNAVFARVTIPPVPDTAFVAYFGHLAGGYDAGYYGYLWSKVLALDMASEFRKAPRGFLCVEVGRRLRDEVYGIANTRDVGESVEKFLGRKTSMKPFLEHVGIKD